MKKQEKENENLILCKNCGGYYDPAEEQCPHCGEDTRANTEESREGGMEVTQYGGGFGQNSVLGRAALVLVVILLLIALAAVAVLGMKALNVMGQFNQLQADSSEAVEQDPADSSASADASVDLTTDEEEAPAEDEQDEPVDEEPDDGAATGISLNYTDITLSAGQATQLVVTVKPDDWTGELTWTTSNKYVATVDATGNVTYAGGGECTITASCESVNVTCQVYCKGDAISSGDKDTSASVKGSYPTSAKSDTASDQKTDTAEEEETETNTEETSTPIKFDLYDITLIEIGHTHTFVVSGGNGTYEWTSADPSIATVSSSGKVTAVSPGTTTVTCTSGDQTQTCIIRVK